MNNVSNNINLDVESRIIHITDTVTVEDIAVLIDRLMSFEREVNNWPQSDNIQWSVNVKPNIS